MNLPLRVLLGYFLIVGVAAFFVLRIFVTEVRPSVRETIEATMIDTANVLAVLAAEDLRAGHIRDGAFAQNLETYRHRKVDAKIWFFHKTSLDFRVLVTDAQGIVMLDTEHSAEGLDHSRWNDVYRTLRGEYGARSTRSNPGDDTSAVFHVAAPVVADGRIIGVLTVAKPVAHFEPIIARSERTILRSGALLLGCALLIGLAVTLWLTRSIRRLRSYARAVAAGERAEPPTSGGRELSELAQAMAAMREKLEGKQYVERYVQALTHELKSPLAALRSAAELLAEGGLSEAEQARFATHVIEQGARMQTTIERLLELSRLEARARAEPGALTDLHALLGAVFSQRRARAEAQAITLHVECATPQPALRAEAQQLELALGNLLDNALDHAPPGSTIEGRVSREGKTLIVTVRDHGPGIPDYALAHLFERFYSLPRPNGRKGSGLGLAIVQEIALQHGGSVSLSNAEGGGALARLSLPAAPAR